MATSLNLAVQEVLLGDHLYSCTHSVRIYFRLEINFRTFHQLNNLVLMTDNLGTEHNI